MPLTREERKLLHQKSRQPTLGSGKPDRSSGNEGDVAYRKIQGTGTVQYLKQDGDWVAMSSSGEAPKQRPISGGGTTRTIISGGGGGVTDHTSLTGLASDDHTQYVLVDGTRAFGADWTNAGNTIADLGTVTTADINGGNIDGTTIATSDIDVTGQTLSLDDNQISGDKVEGGTINSITINTLGGSLDANSQVITNVDIQSGDISGTNIDVTSKTLSLDDDQISGDKVEGGTIASITIDQLGGPMDVNDEELTNVNIDSGAIDNTAIGANTQAAGDFTAIGAVSAGTIVGTTIDATTDFTIDGLVITADNISNDADLNINTDGTTALTIDTSQHSTFAANIYLGNDNAIWMQNNAGNADTSAIFTNTSDELVLRTGGNTDSLKINTSGDVTFFQHANFPDNGKALFGASNDLQIYHNGVHSYINEGGTGNLIVYQGSDTAVFSPTSVTINRDSTFNGDVTISNTDALLNLTSGASNDSVVRFNQDTTQQATIGYDDTDDLLKINNDSNFGGTNHLVVDSSGNLGIGLNNPSNYYSDELVISVADNGGITIANTDTTHAAYIMFADGTSGDSAYRGQVGYDHNNDSFGIWTAANNALMIDTNQNSTFSADVFINDGTDDVFHFDQALSQMYIWDDTPNGVSGLYENYVKLQCLSGGVSKLTTFDADGDEADFSLDIDGDIILDSVTGVILLEKGGTTYGSFTLDAAGPDIELDLPSGSFTIDAAGDIILDADGDDIYFEHGGAERFRMDLDSTPTLAVTGDFTLDGSGSITLDSTTDIALSADGDQITMDNGTTTRFTFNVDSTPELDVTGNFILDGSGTITIDGQTGIFLKENGTEIIRIDTDQDIFFHQYGQTLYTQYGFHNAVTTHHQTSGRGDFEMNYSILSAHIESSSFNNNYGA